MNCEHDYEVLDKDITIETISYYDDGNSSDIEVKGYIVFYCKKCCNVEKKVIP